MTSLLSAFELHTGLGAADAAKLLGYAVPTYYQYRRTGIMPEYAKRHVLAVMALPRHALANLIREYVFDDQL